MGSPADGNRRHQRKRRERDCSYSRSRSPRRREGGARHGDGGGRSTGRRGPEREHSPPIDRRLAPLDFIFSSCWRYSKVLFSGTRIINLMPHGDGCRREERTSHAGGRTSITDDIPALGSIHHARVVNVRPFGLFVELPGYRRNGLVHNSQISEDVVFSREDADDVKMKAMEYFAPQGSQVMYCPHAGYFRAPKPKKIPAGRVTHCCCEDPCLALCRCGSRSRRSGMKAGALPRSTAA